MFTALIAGLLALIGAIGAALIEADAIKFGKGEVTPEDASVVGTWAGNISWRDGTHSWTLKEDGTFAESDGLSGTWFREGDQLELRYRKGTTYVGTITDRRFLGVRHKPDGQKDGTFNLRKSGE